MSIVLLGSTSGSCTLQEQAVAGTTTLTLPTFNGTVGLLVSGTAVTASGTSVNFTGLPAGVRRITVIFNGVSTNGTSPYLIQLGDAGGIEDTGYVSTSTYFASASLAHGSSTAGFFIESIAAASIVTGAVQIVNVSANNFVATGTVQKSTTTSGIVQGSKTLSDVLTQVRITTVNGTDTFDAGTINILYE
jgi:hypothetical protein